MSDVRQWQWIRAALLLTVSSFAGVCERAQAGSVDAIDLSASTLRPADRLAVDLTDLEQEVILLILEQTGRAISSTDRQGVDVVCVSAPVGDDALSTWVSQSLALEYFETAHRMPWQGAAGSAPGFGCTGGWTTLPVDSQSAESIIGLVSLGQLGSGEGQMLKSVTCSQIPTWPERDYVSTPAVPLPAAAWMGAVGLLSVVCVRRHLVRAWT